MNAPRANIIITNYNYGRFLRHAIDSALAQACAGADADVIVVDDGSSDDSRSVIASYGARVTAVLKPNGGQASAFNAGFARSRGDVVLFLDADDVLFPDAVATALDALEDREVAKAHWPLVAIDEGGAAQDRLHPAGRLPDGEYLNELIERGPWMCETPPTSGNAWSRRMLERVLPMPEEPYRICADAYLLAAAPLFGAIRRVDRPLGAYRLHGANNYWNQTFDEAVRRGVEVYELQCRTAGGMLARHGIAHDAARWRRHSWWHRLRDAVGDIVRVVPDGAAFALADDDQWGTPQTLEGRRRIAFPQADGRFSGPPGDGDDAVRALCRAIDAGASYFVVAFPCFWYLDYYSELADHLERHAANVLRNDRVSVFDLTSRRKRSRA